MIKFLDIASVHLPAVPPFSRKQLQLFAFTCRLDQCVTFLRFSRVFPSDGFEYGGMCAMNEYRLASRSEKAMFGLVVKQQGRLNDKEGFTTHQPKEE
jgi:hypothetical protein